MPKHDEIATIPDPEAAALRVPNAQLDNELPSRIDDETLRNLNSFEEAAALFGDDVPLEDWSDYGTGFDIITDKDRLVGTPLVFIEWRFNPGKYGYAFVSALVMTESGEKWILNDGSTGICHQLQGVTDKRVADGRTQPQRGLLVRKGLRRSDYEYEDPETGALIPATTYYLS